MAVRAYRDRSKRDVAATLHDVRSDGGVPKLKRTAVRELSPPTVVTSDATWKPERMMLDGARAAHSPDIEFFPDTGHTHAQVATVVHLLRNVQLVSISHCVVIKASHET